jgi:hypothetical protein
MAKLKYKENEIWKSIAPTQKEFDDLKTEVTTHLADYVLIDTDVVAEINAKLLEAATNNKWVRFIKNVYEITGSIIIPSNSIIYWRHTTIKRKTGSGVFDLIKNFDAVLGNSSILMYNLNIDGNKNVDGLIAENVADRFGGLKLEKVSNSELHNVTVTGTVNAEDTAGIYFKDCSGIDCYKIDGHHNDKTAILLWTSSKIKIYGSNTHDNLGSGISSNNSPECEYHDIETHDNGYSNLSINGLRCKGSNILSYNSAYSGVNIGHVGSPSDETILADVHSYNNTYEGLTISGSNDIVVNGIEVYGNIRNNIRIFESSNRTKMNHVISRNSAGGSGILYEYGTGHTLDDAEVKYNYGSGIYVNNNTEVTIGNKVKSYNNGQGASVNSAGIIVNTATACIIGIECYDDQTPKTQESGIWFAGGTNHICTLANVHDNKTYDIRLTASPTFKLFTNNKGFVTENSGTATILSGTTSITVTHGLSRITTQQISVTPTNSMGNAAKFWISGVTLTQFVINVNADPGATTATFVWKANTLT